jgi:hypothetical protein
MSRSNQTETVNPCTRWFEWDGDKGQVRYYDKALEKKVELGMKFKFLFLDQLASVKGWHDASESGIYSNEVKSINDDILVVKSFKGGEIAKGLYKEIREKAIAAGGHYSASIYIGYMGEDKKLALGNIQFKGAALNAWVDFAKANKANLYKMAIKIVGLTEGIKGKIKYQMPIFELEAISAEADKSAVELDKILQEHLEKYLTKNKTTVESKQENVDKVEELIIEEPAVTTKPESVPHTDISGADDLPF